MSEETVTEGKPQENLRDSKVRVWGGRERETKGACVRVCTCVIWECRNDGKVLRLKAKHEKLDQHRPDAFVIRVNLLVA
jgi:hypothetical protein